VLVASQFSVHFDSGCLPEIKREALSLTVQSSSGNLRNITSKIFKIFFACDMMLSVLCGINL